MGNTGLGVIFNHLKSDNLGEIFIMHGDTLFQKRMRATQNTSVGHGL
jgi:hypothetical protein